MALLDDVNGTIDKISKIATDGVPLKLEHQIDKTSLLYMGVVIVVAGLLLVVAGGLKDYVVGRALR